MIIITTSSMWKRRNLLHLDKYLYIFMNRFVIKHCLLGMLQELWGSNDWNAVLHIATVLLTVSIWRATSDCRASDTGKPESIPSSEVCFSQTSVSLLFFTLSVSNILSTRATSKTAITDKTQVSVDSPSTYVINLVGAFTLLFPRQCWQQCQGR